MDIFEKQKNDKTMMGAGVVLMLSIFARVMHVVVLKLTTDYFSVTEENIMNVIIGLIPSVVMLLYVLIFHNADTTQTDMPKLVLPILFVYQLGVAAWSAWIEYTMVENLGVSFAMTNVVWIVYYVFLIYVTYKGFGNILIIKIIIAGVTIYSMAGSIVTLNTLISYFPEERGMIISQIIAVAGYFCYYLATFLVVPKAVEKRNI